MATAQLGAWRITKTYKPSNDGTEVVDVVYRLEHRPPTGEHWPDRRAAYAADADVDLILPPEEVDQLAKTLDALKALEA